MTHVLEQSADLSMYFKGGPVGVLLIHGLGGTPREMRYVAQTLAREGFTVYCCQLAGHCGTPEELRRSTWQEWYASVEAAHARLARHCDSIVVGGLSMGAMLALHLARHYPDTVHGLLVYAPSFKLNGWAMPWYSWLLGLVRPTPLRIEFDLPEREPYGIKDDRMRAFVLSGMQSGDAGQAGTFSTPLRSFANMGALVAVVRRNLASIRQPALVVHPRNDDMADLGNAFYVQRHLGGIVECLVLDDSYHIVTLDQQRQLVAERSAQFVAGIAAKASRIRDEAGKAGREGRPDKA